MGSIPTRISRLANILNRPVMWLVLFTGFLFLLFIWMSIRSLMASGPIWVEGPALGTINAIRTGRFYQMDALNHLPFAVQTHTPLSYWLGALISTRRIDFWPLRLANMLFSLGGAVLIATWIIGETAEETHRYWLSALFGSMTFLLAPPVFLWSQPARLADSMATFFTLAALLTCLRLRNGWRQYLLFALLGACAVLSKQTALIMLVGSLTVFDLPRRAVRPWLFRLGGMAVLLGIMVLILQYHTSGGFVRNVVSANLVRFSGKRWYDIAFYFTWMFWLFVAVALAVGGFRYGMPAIYFLVATAFGLLTCGKMGSDTMYFFDSSAAGAILAGCAVANIRKYSLISQWIRTAPLAIALAVMVWYGDLHRFRLNLPSYSENYQFMLKFLTEHRLPDHTLLSEDASIPLHLGEPSEIDDPFVFGELWKKEALDSKPLLDAIKAHKFYAVVARDASYWSEPVTTMMVQEYYPVAIIEASPMGAYVVMLPK